MDAAFRYLKWNDDVVGLVVPDLSVRFAEPRFNTTVGLYTHGQTSWTPDQFLQFLSERIMSPARRDIERFMGTKVYLETWVKVKENWRDNMNYIRSFGYDEQ